METLITTRKMMGRRRNEVQEELSTEIQEMQRRHGEYMERIREQTSARSMMPRWEMIERTERIEGTEEEKPMTKEELAQSSRSIRDYVPPPTAGVAMDVDAADRQWYEQMTGGKMLPEHAGVRVTNHTQATLMTSVRSAATETVSYDWKKKNKTTTGNMTVNGTMAGNTVENKRVTSGDSNSSAPAAAPPPMVINYSYLTQHLVFKRSDKSNFTRSQLAGALRVLLTESARSSMSVNTSVNSSHPPIAVRVLSITNVTRRKTLENPSITNYSQHMVGVEYEMKVKKQHIDQLRVWSNQFLLSLSFSASFGHQLSCQLSSSFCPTSHGGASDSGSNQPFILLLPFMSTAAYVRPTATVTLQQQQYGLMQRNQSSTTNTLSSTAPRFAQLKASWSEMPARHNHMGTVEKPMPPKKSTKKQGASLVVAAVQKPPTKRKKEESVVRWLDNAIDHIAEERKGKRREKTQRAMSRLKRTERLLSLAKSYREKVRQRQSGVTHSVDLHQVALENVTLTNETVSVFLSLWLWGCGLLLFVFVFCQLLWGLGIFIFFFLLTRNYYYFFFSFLFLSSFCSLFHSVLEQSHGESRSCNKSCTGFSQSYRKGAPSLSVRCVPWC